MFVYQGDLKSFFRLFSIPCTLSIKVSENVDEKINFESFQTFLIIPSRSVS